MLLSIKQNRNAIQASGRANYFFSKQPSLTIYPQADDNLSKKNCLITGNGGKANDFKV
jgi:hypothetical protein